MEPLQIRFRERAARDLDLFRQHLLEDRPGAPEVEATAHKLAGSAALFGFPEVGAAARDVDRAFAAGGAPDRPLLEALVARLEAICAGPDDAAAPAAAEPADTPGGAETILVVDDDDLLRAHAEGHLRRLGYRVIGAAGGEEALARLAGLPSLDLLFTDLRMPGAVGGQALAEEIRRRRPGLRVLFTSGQGPADGLPPNFLPKPYRRGALAAMVRRVLDEPRGDTDNPRT